MPFCTPEQFAVISDLVSRQTPQQRDLRHLGHDVNYLITGIRLNPLQDYALGFVVKRPHSSIYIASERCPEPDLWVLYEYLTLEGHLAPEAALSRELLSVPADLQPDYCREREHYFRTLETVARSTAFLKQDPLPLIQAAAYLHKRQVSLARPNDLPDMPQGVPTAL